MCKVQGFALCTFPSKRYHLLCISCLNNENSWKHFQIYEKYDIVQNRISFYFISSFRSIRTEKKSLGKIMWRMSPCRFIFQKQKQRQKNWQYRGFTANVLLLFFPSQTTLIFYIFSVSDRIMEPSSFWASMFDSFCCCTKNK